MFYHVCRHLKIFIIRSLFDSFQISCSSLLSQIYECPFQKSSYISKSKSKCGNEKQRGAPPNLAFEIAIHDVFRCFALCRANKIHNKRNVRIHTMKFLIYINITKATNNMSVPINSNTQAKYFVAYSQMVITIKEIIGKKTNIPSNMGTNEHPKPSQRQKEKQGSGVVMHFPVLALWSSPNDPLFCPS